MGFLMNWDCWRTVIAALVAGGQEPQMMRCKDGQVRLSYVGVPIYINDFIVTSDVTVTAPVYAILAEPQRGMCMIVNKNCPEPKVYPVNEEQSPFKSFVAEWNVQLVSTTDRALGRIPDFPATVRAPALCVR